MHSALETKIEKDLWILFVVYLVMQLNWVTNELGR